MGGRATEESAATAWTDEYQTYCTELLMATRPTLFCMPNETQRPCSASAVIPTQHDESLTGLYSFPKVPTKASSEGWLNSEVSISVLILARKPVVSPVLAAMFPAGGTRLPGRIVPFIPTGWYANCPHPSYRWPKRHWYVVLPQTLPEVCTTTFFPGVHIVTVSGRLSLQ